MSKKIKHRLLNITTHETFRQYVYRMAGKLTKEKKPFMKCVGRIIYAIPDKLSEKQRDKYVTEAARMIPKRVVCDCPASTHRKKCRLRHSNELELDAKKKLVNEYVTLIQRRGNTSNGINPTPPLEIFDKYKPVNVESLARDISRFPNKLVKIVQKLHCVLKITKEPEIDKVLYKKSIDSLVKQAMKYISINCKCDGRGGHNRNCEFYKNPQRQTYIKHRYLKILLYAVQHYGNDKLEC